MLTTTQPVSSTRREFKSNLSARGNDGHSTLSSSDGETSSSFVKQEQFLQSNHATQVSAMNDCGTTGKKVRSNHHAIESIVLRCITYSFTVLCCAVFYCIASLCIIPCVEF